MAEAQDEFIVQTDKLSNAAQQATNAINNETKAVDKNTASLKKTAGVLNSVAGSAKNLNTVSKGLGASQKALSAVDTVLAVDFTSFGGVVRSLIPIMKSGTAGIKALTKAFLSNPFTVVIALVTVLIANFSTLTSAVGKLTNFLYEHITASGRHVAAMKSEVAAMNTTVTMAQKMEKSLQNAVTAADAFYETSLKQYENKLIASGKSTSEIETALNKKRMSDLATERKTVSAGYDSIINKLRASLNTADSLIASYNKKHKTVGAEFTSGELEQEKKIRAERAVTHKQLMAMEQKRSASNIQYTNEYLKLQQKLTNDEKAKSDARVAKNKKEHDAKLKNAKDYYATLSRLAEQANRDLASWSVQVFNPSEWTKGVEGLRTMAAEGAKIVQQDWMIAQGITDITKATKEQKQEYEAVGKTVSAAFEMRIDEGVKLTEEAERQIDIQKKYGEQIKNNKTYVDDFIKTYDKPFLTAAQNLETEWRAVKAEAMSGADASIKELNDIEEAAEDSAAPATLQNKLKAIDKATAKQIAENEKIREAGLKSIADLEKRYNDEEASDLQVHNNKLKAINTKYLKDKQLINASLDSTAVKKKKLTDLTNEHTAAIDKENAAYENQKEKLAESNVKQQVHNDEKRAQINLAADNANTQAKNTAATEADTATSEADAAAKQKQIEAIESLSSVMSAASELADENSKTQTGLQIGVATANMAAGLAKSIASSNDVPYPGNIAAMASSVATLLSYFATIKNLISQSKSYSKGGLIHGAGTGTSDSITAKVSNGESVINARSTAQYAPLLSAINRANGGNAIGNSQLRVNQSKMTAQYYNPVVSVESINRQTKIYNAVNVE